MLAPAAILFVPDTEPSRNTNALREARDQIRKECLFTVLLTYADTTEDRDALRAHLRTMTVREYSTTLQKGLRDGVWPWTPS